MGRGLHHKRAIIGNTGRFISSSDLLEAEWRSAAVQAEIERARERKVEKRRE